MLIVATAGAAHAASSDVGRTGVGVEASGDWSANSLTDMDHTAKDPACDANDVYTRMRLCTELDPDGYDTSKRYKDNPDVWHTAASNRKPSNSVAGKVVSGLSCTGRSSLRQPRGHVHQRQRLPSRRRFLCPYRRGDALDDRSEPPGGRYPAWSRRAVPKRR
ncbi:hypothetical protein [Streptomyces sp. NPDC059459]|uniref:hypothetical protein n=1 Tax=unclassified Streptomyces TaxID=2593676 RepID=UPI0036C98262